MGKSTGVKNLKSKTNIWYNADKKNPVWKGGREEYGKKNNPTAPYHVLPNFYEDIITHIKSGMEKGMFEKNVVAFITGHTEVYKSGLETRVRLKTLGKLANKMQIESKLETVLYAKVEKDLTTGENSYILHTQNDGLNTARSPEGMFEGVIKNDYNFILECIEKY